MYTILVNENHELVTTQRQRIMQRSKIVDNLHFLIPPVYEGKDITNCTVSMEYLPPNSKEYQNLFLVKSNELYKNMLEYKLPFDTNLTQESGDLEVQLTMILVEMDADRNISQWVRKTSPTIIPIIPIAAWSNIIPDKALTAHDQRIIALDARIHALNDVAGSINDAAENGIPVVDFGESKDSDEEDGFGAVEF